MSGLCPFAAQKIIAPGSNDPAIRPRVAILHVAVSMVASLFEFFRDRSGGIESHFYITWTGKIEQYRNIYWQADANLDANDFAVSIETAGLGSGKWNPLQLRAIKRLLTWLNDETEDAIPLRKIDRWDGSGIGYHTLFGSPSHWTPVAKSCPGPNRIKQFDSIIVPWMKTALTAVAKVARFGIITLNMGSASTVRVVADLHKLSKRARVICLQEAGDRGVALRLFLASHPAWAIYRPSDEPGQASLPILYKRRVFRLRKATSHLAVPERRVVEKGARKIGSGPAVIKAKWVNEVELEHRKSGAVIHVLNTHTLPSASRKNLPPAEKAMRLAHFAEHASALALLVAQIKGTVAVCGDLNANPDFSLLRSLASQTQLTGWSRVHTHGLNSYDHVLTRAEAGLTVEPTEAIKTSSDHDAALAVLTIKEH